MQQLEDYFTGGMMMVLLCVDVLILGLLRITNFLIHLL